MRGEREFQARKKALKVFRAYENCFPQNLDKVHPRWYDQINVDKLLGIYKSTKVPCSCHMCGQQRKYFGDTLQEKRELLKFEDWLHE